MNNVITKNMNIKEIKAVLRNHGVYMDSFWFIALWALMKECDYIEIEGYGENVEFVQKYNKRG